jgi:hypothetical protein
MPTLIIGVLVLVAVLWALNVVSKVDPKLAARVMKAGGGCWRWEWRSFWACAAN